jgi:hypothetical protein
MTKTNQERKEARKFGLVAKILRDDALAISEAHFFHPNNEYQVFANIKLKCGRREGKDEIIDEKDIRAVRSILSGLRLTLERTSKERIPYLEINPDRSGELEIKPYNAKITCTTYSPKKPDKHDLGYSDGCFWIRYGECYGGFNVYLEDHFPELLFGVDSDKTGFGRK